MGGDLRERYYAAFSRRYGRWADVVLTVFHSTCFFAPDGNADLHQAERRSDRIKLLELFWEAAIKHADREGHPPWSEQGTEILCEATRIGSGITDLYVDYGVLGFCQKNANVKFAPRLFRLRANVDSGNALKGLIEDKKPPPLDELELAVKEYLESPFRSNEIDRWIIRLLFEHEPRMYIEHISFRAPSLKPYSKLARDTKLAYSSWWFRSTACFAIGAVLAGLLGFMLSELWEWAEALAWVVLLISIGCSVLIALAMNSGRGRRAKESARKTVQLAQMAVDKLIRYRGNGPIALTEIRRDVEEMREAGFIQPQILFGMLDILDKEGRTIV